MPLAPVPGVQPDFRFVNASGETSPYTTAIAKHAIQMQDPAFEPHNAKRNVPQERSGAAYYPAAFNGPTVAPEAGATLSGGRVLPPSINRSSSLTFQDGMLEMQ